MILRNLYIAMLRLLVSISDSLILVLRCILKLLIGCMFRNGEEEHQKYLVDSLRRRSCVSLFPIKGLLSRIGLSIMGCRVLWAENFMMWAWAIESNLSIIIHEQLHRSYLIMNSTQFFSNMRASLRLLNFFIVWETIFSLSINNFFELHEIIHFVKGESDFFFTQPRSFSRP